MRTAIRLVVMGRLEGLKLLPSELPDAWTPSRVEQVAVAEQVYARRGWARWLGCARQVGLA